LATIDPQASDESWVGSTCLTGDGKTVVAVIAPQPMLNRPGGMDRGGVGYAVDVATGAVTPIVTGLTAAYFNPGCGASSTVALERFEGQDQAATRVLIYDTARRATTHTYFFPGELTSAVPSGDGLLAVRDKSLLTIDSSGIRSATALPGAGYDVRPALDGAGPVLLVRTASGDAQVLEQTASGVAKIGSGPLSRTRILSAGQGQRIAVNADSADAAAALIKRGPKTDREPLGGSASGAVIAVPASGKDDKALPILVGSGMSTSGRNDSSAAAAPITTAVPSMNAGQPSAVGMPAAQGTLAPNVAAANVTTPKCAVPRNDPQRQVKQPNSTQVDWAVQQAVRMNLKGAVLTRPAGYENVTGLPSYQPSVDFASSLTGGGIVPRSVVEGVLAQESNFLQASWHALPGVPGNPLIGDYYGSLGGINSIDFNSADCGYGIGQITTGMETASTALSANGKIKVALDYAENIADAISILSSTWNKLSAAGITLNGGSPTYLENWYFTLWAYNSGFQPDAAHGNTTGCTPSPTCTDGYGNWGLGWTNNPINTLWDPARAPFLKLSYADAATPQKWPYQEKVFGWMAHPQLDYTGHPDYLPSTPASGPADLTVPPFASFCVLSVNNCDPNFHVSGNSSLDYCEYINPSSPYYRHCWWHSFASYLSCPGQCQTSSLTVATTATEPASSNPHPADCQSSLPANAIIVDELPEPVYNLAGCGARNWQSKGTFALSSLSTSGGYPVSVIDTHQVGAGFGGHIYFTHNRALGDTAHQVVGTWTPPTLANQAYNVEVHIPDTGAATSGAQYTVTQADGTSANVIIDQHLNHNAWSSLGYFNLASNAKVTLSNWTVGEPTPGLHDVGFDAVAFVPVAGTVTQHSLDAVQIFSVNQSLDTNMPTSIDSPLRTDATLKAWATEYASGGVPWDNSAGTYHPGVASYPACTGAVAPSCVGSHALAVAQAWNNAALSQHPAQWMGFSNPTPPSVITSGVGGTFAADTSYKTQVHIDASALLTTAGQYVSGSARLNATYRIGDTHLPDFMIGFMTAVNTDYGVAPPSGLYSALNQNLYTEESSQWNAFQTGVAPGTAYLPNTYQTVNNSTGCIDFHGVEGGPMAYRSMDATAVSGNVKTWAAAVNALVSQGKAPAAVGDYATQIYQLFFNADLFTGTYPYGVSLFVAAPPIWTQVNANICPNGSVSTDSSGLSIVESSLMPDLYLYIDRSNFLPNGTPVQTGDYKSFSNIPTVGNPTSPTNAYGLCDFNARGLRAGNPWGVALLDAELIDPQTMVFCNAPATEYGTGGD
jgi:hypothetical protein